MKIIVLTLPEKIDNEATKLVEILNNGVDKIHIRKKNCTQKEVIDIIKNIPKIYHQSLYIHYYKDILNQFPSINYHHSGDSLYDKKILVKQTKSCHYLSELKQDSSYEYNFISPVFDSISKPGYLANIDLSSLKKYLYKHNLKNVVAMGGINHQNIRYLKELPLYGVALLGAVWYSNDPITYIKNLKEKLV